MADTLSEILNYSVAGITVNKILSAVIMVVIGLIIIKIIMRILTRVLGKTSLDEKIQKLVCNIVKVLMLILLILLVLGSLGISITSLIALFSVVGLAISLAVQNFLSNVAGGLQLLTSKPFKIGDFIEAGDSTGTVRQIGLFYTNIVTLDNKLIQMPNSDLASAKIINYTAEENRRVDLTFTTSYDAPVSAVKQAILGVAQAHDKIQQDPAPFVRVSNYGDNSIEYTVRVWCATPDYWDVYFDLLEQVKAAFDQVGVEMTYPHLNVHMVPAPDPKAQ